MQKDNRKIYNKKKIEFKGTHITFDGKGNPDNKSLTVYRYYGDITLFNDVFKQFCQVNNYEKVYFFHR